MSRSRPVGRMVSVKNYKRLMRAWVRRARKFSSPFNRKSKVHS